MPTLSASEIRTHAAKAGFTGTDLDIAVAVALAESGGNTQAHNGTGQDNSHGLWQINMYGAMGPARRKQFGLTSNEQLFDPAINAKVAYAIFKSQGWRRGWTTYGTEKYETILKRVKDGADIEGAIGIDGKPVEQEDKSMTGIPEALNAFGSTVFKGVTNLTGIGIAVALLIAGVVLLIASSSSAKKAVNIAANVVPGGTAVKTAVKGVAKS